MPHRISVRADLRSIIPPLSGNVTASFGAGQRIPESRVRRRAGQKRVNAARSVLSIGKSVRRIRRRLPHRRSHGECELARCRNCWPFVAVLAWSESCSRKSFALVKGDRRLAHRSECPSKMNVTNTKFRPGPEFREILDAAETSARTRTGLC